MSDAYREEVLHSEEKLLTIEKDNERIPVHLDNFMRQRLVIFRDKAGTYYLVNAYRNRVDKCDNLLDMTNLIAREYSDKPWLDALNLANQEERKKEKKNVIARSDS